MSEYDSGFGVTFNNEGVPCFFSNGELVPLETTSSVSTDTLVIEPRRGEIIIEIGETVTVYEVARIETTAISSPPNLGTNGAGTKLQ
ncbi:hypothetical protein HY469_01590 [Candidatus Roizmanbacteria bacterium]|nr:hypothetical protein [Candidatus Roizmanbacteria bacterium]